MLKSKINKVTKSVLFSIQAKYHFVMSVQQASFFITVYEYMPH